MSRGSTSNGRHDALLGQHGFLFRDRPFLERIAAAAAAGFDAVEFHDEAQGTEPGPTRRRAGRDPAAGVRAQRPHMGDTAGCAAIPGAAAQARADIDAAVAVANAVDAGAIHVLDRQDQLRGGPGVPDRDLSLRTCALRPDDPDRTDLPRRDAGVFSPRPRSGRRHRVRDRPPEAPDPVQLLSSRNPARPMPHPLPERRPSSVGHVQIAWVPGRDQTT